jgi:2-succinyl-6-hydroxy-2,4-cyclohexadiene-1-carboxylate synthase
MMRNPQLWPHPRALDPKRPALILLHGFTGSASVWNDVVALLDQSFECLALDLPGHGGNRCEDHPDAFSLPGVCDLVVDLLDRLSLPRVHLWGYSMGGRIAMQFALRNPMKISRLVLESASPGIVDPAERAARLAADQRLAQRIVEIGVESFAEEWMAQALFASQQAIPAARREKARAIRVANSAAGLASALGGFSVGRQEPIQTRLGELTMPVLLATGEFDLKYRAFSEQMARSIPGSQLRIIPGSGHAPHWENPAAMSACVRSFLLRDQSASRDRVTR